LQIGPELHERRNENDMPRSIFKVQARLALVKKGLILSLVYFYGKGDK
jgi:hypothetical protein